MSTCIVVAQGFMVPMAILVGKKADDWGRKSLFLAGFAVLSLRGCLYVLSDDRYWLIAVQSLDGLGAGLSIGAAVSTSLAGFVTVHAGYSVAFLVLAAIAVSGFGLYFFGMPETGDAAKRTAEATAKLAPT